MARFRLKGKHYLAIEGCEWEHKEISDTGKQVRKMYPVPMYLDHEDGSDWNYPDGIYVSTKFDKRYPKDHIMLGPCTVDMEPMDEEAEALHKEILTLGEHPIESLPGTFAEALLDKLQRQVDGIAAKPAAPDNRVAALEKQVEEMRSLILSLTKPGLTLGAK